MTDILENGQYKKADSGDGTAASPFVPKIAGTVTPAAGELHLGEIGGRGIVVSDEITRPANATAFTAKDVIGTAFPVTAMAYTLKVVTLTVSNNLSVGDAITVIGVNSGFTVANIDGDWVCQTGTNATTIVFTVATQPTGTTPQTITAGTIAKLGRLVNIFRVAGGSGYITKLRLQCNLQTFLDQVRVHFYSRQVTAIADNAAFTLLWANRDYRLGYVDLPALTTEASGSDSSAALATPSDGGSKLPLFVRNEEATPGKDLFYMLETMGTGTPLTSGVYMLKASLDAN